MSECVDFFVDRIITTRAVTVRATFFGTSRRYDVFVIVVSQSGNGYVIGVDGRFARLVNEQTTTFGTSIVRDISVFGTSGSLFFHKLDVMSMS